MACTSMCNRQCGNTFQANHPHLFLEDSICRSVDIVRMQGETSLIWSQQMCWVDCSSDTMAKWQAIIAAVHTGLHIITSQYLQIFGVLNYIFWPHQYVRLHFWSFITGYRVFGYTAKISNLVMKPYYATLRCRNMSDVLVHQTWIISHSILYTYRDNIWSIKYTLCQLRGKVWHSYATSTCRWVITNLPTNLQVLWKKSITVLNTLCWCSCATEYSDESSVPDLKDPHWYPTCFCLGEYTKQLQHTSC